MYFISFVDRDGYWISRIFNCTFVEALVKIKESMGEDDGTMYGSDAIVYAERLNTDQAVRLLQAGYRMFDD